MIKQICNTNHLSKVDIAVAWGGVHSTNLGGLGLGLEGVTQCQNLQSRQMQYRVATKFEKSFKRAIFQIKKTPSQGQNLQPCECSSNPDNIKEGDKDKHELEMLTPTKIHSYCRTGKFLQNTFNSKLPKIHVREKCIFLKLRPINVDVYTNYCLTVHIQYKMQVS